MTGLLSPDPDAHVLRGALVYGSVRRGGGAGCRGVAFKGCTNCLYPGCSYCTPYRPFLTTSCSPPSAPRQGRSDDFEDRRDADSNWVGIENNAGLAAALAGINEVRGGGECGRGRVGGVGGEGSSGKHSRRLPSCELPHSKPTAKHVPHFCPATSSWPQLDPGMWEVCLQDYGIYRQSAICGKYLTV